jgi:GT2 family glycosyltransferase
MGMGTKVSVVLNHLPMLEHRQLAQWLLAGNGLEIGAFDRPMPLPEDCRVIYADLRDHDASARIFPEIAPQALAPVSIVLDLDRGGLAACTDGMFDFVIVNDVLSRLGNPFYALAEVFRVLRSGGMAVLAVRDMRYAYDYQLPTPSFLALLDAWNQGIQDIPEYAYREFLQATNPPIFWDTKEKFSAALAVAHRRRESVHAWDSDSFRQFLDDAFAAIGIEAVCCFESLGDENDSEHFSVWQKADGSPDDLAARWCRLSRKITRWHEDHSTLNTLMSRLHAQEIEIAESTEMLGTLRASTSWRLTRPLRAARRITRLAFRLFDPVGRNVFSQMAAAQGWRHALWAGLGDTFALPAACGDTAITWHLAPVFNHPSVNRRHEETDIIVCVHNALEDTRSCLTSIVRHTLPPYSLILVDDGSDLPTRDFLAAFARNQGARLIRNETACGYTRAANQGMRTSSATYVVLLNSDTLVTPDWLERMSMCAASSFGIGMVGPLSNTASWQSIPEQEENGDWATNSLPVGIDANEMAIRVATRSARIYPRIPFLNGFCLLVKRQLIESIGYFDEEMFGRGYGEENDYCLRARHAKWELAIADDVYIFHTQSKSYSHERRKLLCDAAAKALETKHGSEPIFTGVAACRTDRVLQGLRARARTLAVRHECVTKGRYAWEGRSVLFVLPVSQAGGGANVIISEARAMLAMGVDARILNLEKMKHDFELAYPTLEIPVHYIEDDRGVPEIASRFDAVIASVNFTVEWLRPLCALSAPPSIGYYIQDFEPWFYQSGTLDERRARESYTALPAMRRFAKTEWNRDMVQNEIAASCTVIGPSCDVDRFMPRPRQLPPAPGGRIRVCAMVRPDTPRRAPLATMQILRTLQHAHPGAVEIVIFGAWSDNPGFLNLPRDFDFVCVGEQTPEQMAALLNEVDIFADFSPHQAMGLTAMEAMACGAATILPLNGGTNSFARHEMNALLVDTASAEACFAALERLVCDPLLRARLQSNALADIVQFFPERAALNLLNTLFNGGVE